MGRPRAVLMGVLQRLLLCCLQPQVKEEASGSGVGVNAPAPTAATAGNAKSKRQKTGAKKSKGLFNGCFKRDSSTGLSNADAPCDDPAAIPAAAAATANGIADTSRRCCCDTPVVKSDTRSRSTSNASGSSSHDDNGGASEAGGAAPSAPLSTPSSSATLPTSASSSGTVVTIDTDDYKQQEEQPEPALIVIGPSPATTAIADEQAAAAAAATTTVPVAAPCASAAPTVNSASAASYCSWAGDHQRTAEKLVIAAAAKAQRYHYEPGTPCAARPGWYNKTVVPLAELIYSSRSTVVKPMQLCVTYGSFGQDTRRLAPLGCVGTALMAARWFLTSPRDAVSRPEQLDAITWRGVTAYKCALRRIQRGDLGGQLAQAAKAKGGGLLELEHALSVLPELGLEEGLELQHEMGVGGMSVDLADAACADVLEAMLSVITAGAYIAIMKDHFFTIEVESSYGGPVRLYDSWGARLHPHCPAAYMIRFDGPDVPCQVTEYFMRSYAGLPGPSGMTLSAIVMKTS